MCYGCHILMHECGVCGVYCVVVLTEKSKLFSRRTRMHGTRGTTYSKRKRRREHHLCVKTQGTYRTYKQSHVFHTLAQIFNSHLHTNFVSDTRHVYDVDCSKLKTRKWNIFLSIRPALKQEVTEPFPTWYWDTVKPG